MATKLRLNQIAAGGWESLGACTYEGADAPTFTFSIASDVTALLSVGQRIKLTQTTVKYFIITAVGAFSAGKTIITVYGGTDYTLANAAITVPYFSIVKAPFGFPLSPAKWTVEVTDVTERSQSTPTGGTWYNLGSIAISIPIGIWNTSYQLSHMGGSNASTYTDIVSTLSTANNSESDVDFTTLSATDGASSNLRMYHTVTRQKTLTIAAKTSYYLNSKTSVTSTFIYWKSNISKLIIRAVSSYL